MPNAGRERAVAYAVLSTGLAWCKANFPERSLHASQRALPSDSPARLLYDGGLELESDDRATGRVIQLVEMLRRQLTVDTVASAAAF